MQIISSYGVENYEWTGTLEERCWSKHFLVLKDPGLNRTRRQHETGRPSRLRRQIRPLPPTEPAARDEGPRLIPLGFMKEQTGLEHYLELADIALGRRKFRDRLP